MLWKRAPLHLLREQRYSHHHVQRCTSSLSRIEYVFLWSLYANSFLDIYQILQHTQSEVKCHVILQSLQRLLLQRSLRASSTRPSLTVSLSQNWSALVSITSVVPISVCSSLLSPLHNSSTSLGIFNHRSLFILCCNRYTDVLLLAACVRTVSVSQSMVSSWSSNGQNYSQWNVVIQSTTNRLYQVVLALLPRARSSSIFNYWNINPVCFTFFSPSFLFCDFFDFDFFF